MSPLGLNLPPISLPIPPLWILTEPQSEFSRVIQQIPIGYLFYIC